MITCQTYDLPDNKEAEILSAAIQLIGEKKYTEALEVLVSRHDKLIEKPKLRFYGL